MKTDSDIKQVYPPSCIGILGGGQLARLIASAAKNIGYKIAILEPDKDPPAKHFADTHICGDYDSIDGLTELASISEVITCEFENVPIIAFDILKSLNATVYPDKKAFEITQDRLIEKTVINMLGIQTVDFIAINKDTEFDKINTEYFPAILKTTRFGYDGKGQIHVKNIEELKTIYSKINSPAILEKKTAIKQEFSLIIARNIYGINIFPPIHNIHKDGILEVSFIPANIDTDILCEAYQIADKVINELNYIGVLTIEFFITENNRLLVNELAPRVHNSGHITIETCNMSQFEQHIKAICNLHLGNILQIQNGMMYNVLGENVSNKKLLNEFPDGKLYLYEKTIAKQNRKMGHFSLTGNNLLEKLILLRKN